MIEKEKFHCHEAPNSVAAEEFCLEKCKSTQRGVKAECPESVRIHPLRGRLPEERKEK